METFIDLSMKPFENLLLWQPLNMAIVVPPRMLYTNEGKTDETLRHNIV